MRLLSYVKRSTVLNHRMSRRLPKLLATDMKKQSSEQPSYPVTLHHELRGQLGEGMLSFGDRQATSVALNFDRPSSLVDGERIEVVKAVVRDTGHTYTLCTCTTNHFLLHAEYLIEADITEPEFEEIVARYSDVSEWFLHWQKIKGNVGENLSWTQISKPLSVSISTDDEQFTLASNYVGTREVSGEDTVLHEHVEFSFVSSGAKFSLSDMTTKTLELSCLLATLIAYPVTLLSVYISAGNGRFARVHFATFERPARDTTDSGFWLKCFIQKPQIEDRWQTIFDHYYKSKYRKLCWIRLAGMQRYDGFWEYKALGYVSLLDRYVTIRTEGLDQADNVPPSKDKLATFRQGVIHAMPSASDVLVDELTRMAGQVFAYKPRFDFGQKYRLAMSKTDADVVRIIAFSNADFQFVKRLRDRIAHGDDHGLKESDFPRAISTVGKIELLLTYWAFLDFGLTTEDFIKCLRTSHSPLRLAARLDRVHLDRVTGSAEFFSVTKETLDEMMRTKGIQVFACFLRDAKGALHFSEKHTTIYKDWNKNPSRQSGIQHPKDIFGVDDNAARFVGHAYFECGDEQLELHHLWIIDCERG
jgi:hypothetical protein